MSRPGRGVNLDERNLRAGVLELAQTQGVLIDLLGGRLGIVERREQALDDHRPNFRDEEDVGEDLLQGDFTLVDGVHPRLGAGVQLGPDFIVTGELFEPALDFGEIKSGCVGDQNYLEEREVAECSNVGDGLHAVREVWAESRLAITAQCHMTQLQQFLGQVLVD